MKCWQGRYVTHTCTRAHTVRHLVELLLTRNAVAAVVLTGTITTQTLLHVFMHTGNIHPNANATPGLFRVVIIANSSSVNHICSQIEWNFCNLFLWEVSPAKHLLLH